MKMNTIILALTTLSSGLMAGLFYSWSISVTPGLKRVGDKNYLQAFQSMNRAILNPAFYIFFFSLVIFLPLLCYLYYKPPVSPEFWYILSATILYLVGIMTITFFGNVPVNNTLEVLRIESMTPEQMASFRFGFESKWNNLNMIRTICASLSFVLLIIACLQTAGG